MGVQWDNGGAGGNWGATRVLGGIGGAMGQGVGAGGAMGHGWALGGTRGAMWQLEPGWVLGAPRGQGPGGAGVGRVAQPSRPSSFAAFAPHAPHQGHRGWAQGRLGGGHGQRGAHTHLCTHTHMHAHMCTHTCTPIRCCCSTGCCQAPPTPPQHPWGLCSPCRSCASPGATLRTAPGLPTHKSLARLSAHPPQLPSVPGPQIPQEFFPLTVMQKCSSTRSPTASAAASSIKITGIFLICFLISGSWVRALAGRKGGGGGCVCSSPSMPDPGVPLPPRPPLHTPNPRSC